MISLTETANETRLRLSMDDIAERQLSNRSMHRIALRFWPRGYDTHTSLVSLPFSSIVSATTKAVANPIAGLILTTMAGHSTPHEQT
jgi:hypothetical protein